MIAQKSKEIEDIDADSRRKVLAAEQRAQDIQQAAIKSNQSERAVTSDRLTKVTSKFSNDLKKQEDANRLLYEKKLKATTRKLEKETRATSKLAFVRLEKMNAKAEKLTSTIDDLETAYNNNARLRRLLEVSSVTTRKLEKELVSQREEFQHEVERLTEIHTGKESKCKLQLRGWRWITV